MEFEVEDSELDLTDDIKKAVSKSPYTPEELIKLGLYSVKREEYLDRKRGYYMHSIEEHGKRILEDIYEMKEI